MRGAFCKARYRRMVCARGRAMLAPTVRTALYCRRGRRPRRPGIRHECICLDMHSSRKIVQASQHRHCEPVRRLVWQSVPLAEARGRETRPLRVQCRMRPAVLADGAAHPARGQSQRRRGDRNTRQILPWYPKSKQLAERYDGCRESLRDEKRPFFSPVFFGQEPKKIGPPEAGPGDGSAGGTDCHTSAAALVRNDRGGSAGGSSNCAAPGGFGKRKNPRRGKFLGGGFSDSYLNSSLTRFWTAS